MPLRSGKATVAGLASRGATVYMGARSEEKATQAIESLKQEFPRADLRYLYMDLTRLETVVAAATKVRRYVLGESKVAIFDDSSRALTILS